jgi:hypothetical protein
MTILAIAIAFLAGLVIGARVNRGLMIKQAKAVYEAATPEELSRAVGKRRP